MPDFQLVSDFRPMGDQPAAIAKLLEGTGGYRHQTLLGATGTGKTFVMARSIQELQPPRAGAGPQQDARRPALLPSSKSSSPTTPSSTSSPTTTTTSPKPTSPAPTPTSRRTRTINEEIDKLRHAATRALLSGAT